MTLAPLPPEPSRLRPRRSFWSFTPGPSSLGDAREFLQRRVTLYLGFLLVLFGTFYVIDAGDLLVHSGSAGLLGLGHLAHLGLVLGLLLAWSLVRRRSRSSLVLAVSEALATLGVAGVAVAVLLGLPRDQLAAGPMLGLCLVLVARAGIVPSSGTRTLVVGGCVTAIAIGGYLVRQGTDGFAAFTPPWMVAFTLASAFVSRVIYGLQEQVRRARQLGQYVLEQQLGQGGMGVVYRARHQLLRRPTAVKLMSPGRSGGRDLARFEEEVRQTARLSHPNTVTIYDYGRGADGTFYYAMELLEGATLDRIVERTGPMPPARVIRILSQAAGALAEAHGIALIHRDIKPSNIMLCHQGGEVDVVKVLDFGLVKDLAASSELTLEGSLTGTPAFMSPESIQDPKRVGPASDLYALGAVGYYLLTGCHVFEGKTVVEVCSHHLMSEPVPPSQRIAASLPAELEALILRCLKKNPEQRSRSAHEFRASLLALPDKDGWGEDEARRFWNEHREALERAGVDAVSAESATLAVDLAGRS